MKLTEESRGKHHLGDFLPPDELEKFMEKCQAIKDGRTPDLSDYKVTKLSASSRIEAQGAKAIGIVSRFN